jgi:hypothetical protein
MGKSIIRIKDNYLFRRKVHDIILHFLEPCNFQKTEHAVFGFNQNLIKTFK